MRNDRGPPHADGIADFALAGWCARRAEPLGARMPSRRNLIIGGAAILSGASTLHWVAAQGLLSVAAARQFLQQSGDKLVSILGAPSEWPEKRHQVEALINLTMDVYGIARFALGRGWTAATETQRNEIVRLFPRVLVGNVARTVGVYQGFSFAIQRGIQLGEAIEVATTVLRPGDAPHHVIWLVTSVDGSPKIVDIIAEGASMRITQRDDCASFLPQHSYSIPALIEALLRGGRIQVVTNLSRFAAARAAAVASWRTGDQPSAASAQIPPVAERAQKFSDQWSVLKVQRPIPVVSGMRDGPYTFLCSSGWRTA